MYSDCIGEIHELAERYRSEWELPGLKIAFSAARGYHLTLPAAAAAAGGGLPEALVQAVRARNVIAATTEELSSLSDRAKEALFNIYSMVCVITASLSAAVRASINVLFAVAESLAVLDLLHSFASMVRRWNPPESLHIHWQAKAAVRGDSPMP